MYIKKLLNSDWLRAVQFKCNTSAKRVTTVQNVYHQYKLHIVILDYDWLKDNRKFSESMISRKMRSILSGNFEKSFLEWKKMASRKISRRFLRANFFMFIFLISNQTRKTVWLLIKNINMKKFARRRCRKIFLEATFSHLRKRFSKFPHKFSS